MRSEHKQVFFDVAQQLTCWIGLREPNPLSDKWIGRPGAVPKDEACKAKTADNSAFRFAGLVVDPTRCPQGFKRTTLAAATATWKNKFLHGGRLPAGFTCVEGGPESGLVKLRGSYLFADFDLMAINRSTENGDFVPTSIGEQTQLFRAVKPALNRGLRVPMIQHGAEMMWRGGVGGRESEYVLWFGPGRRFNRWPSSMPRGGH
jgi:hypothetical protein